MEKAVYNGDVEIATQSFGSPQHPALMLIAGATVSMLFWDNAFCEQLADKGHYVIRYDNRDVGQSTCYPPGKLTYGLAEMTDDAIAVLDGYHIKSASFMGMSLGGLIAQIVATKYPDRVESIVLMSTGPYAHVETDVPEMDTRILDQHAKAAQVDWTDEDAVVSYLLDGAQLMVGKKPFDAKRAESYIRSEFGRAVSYTSMFNHAQLVYESAYINRLDEISVPVLIIHGTEDLIWHFKNAEILQRMLPRAKLHTLEGTGHELHAADFETIANAVSEHITGRPEGNSLRQLDS